MSAETHVILATIWLAIAVLSDYLSVSLWAVVMTVGFCVGAIRAGDPGE